MVLVGLAMVIGSWLWRQSVEEFAGSASHAEATIVRVERGSNSDSQFPVFTFEDVAGRSYEIRSTYSSNSSIVGDKADVSYDPAAPYDAILTEVASDSVAGWMMAGRVLGGIFILAGVLVIWTHRWWDRQERMRQG